MYQQKMKTFVTGQKKGLMDDLIIIFIDYFFKEISKFNYALLLLLLLFTFMYSY